MRTEEEVIKEITENRREAQRLSYQSIAMQRTTLEIELAARIKAFEWILEETKEEPLTHIELKQLRAIMREYKEKKCIYDVQCGLAGTKAHCRTHGFDCPNNK